MSILVFWNCFVIRMYKCLGFCTFSKVLACLKQSFVLFTKVLACLKQSFTNHSGEGLGNNDAKSDVARDFTRKKDGYIRN